MQIDFRYTDETGKVYAVTDVKLSVAGLIEFVIEDKRHVISVVKGSDTFETIGAYLNVRKGLVRTIHYKLDGGTYAVTDVTTFGSKVYFKYKATNYAVEHRDDVDGALRHWLSSNKFRHQEALKEESETKLNKKLLKDLIIEKILDNVDRDRLKNGGVLCVNVLGDLIAFDDLSIDKILSHSRNFKVVYKTGFYVDNNGDVYYANGSGLQRCALRVTGYGDLCEVAGVLTPVNVKG